MLPGIVSPAGYGASVTTVVQGDFEGDEDKAASNLTKHGVSFEETMLAMRDPRSVDFEDLVETEKLITLATSPLGRILYIVSTERRGRIRLISSRHATPRERRRYDQAD